MLPNLLFRMGAAAALFVSPPPLLASVPRRLLLALVPGADLVLASTVSVVGHCKFSAGLDWVLSWILSTVHFKYVAVCIACHLRGRGAAQFAALQCVGAGVLCL
jgi:hypothetical protein